MKKNIFVLTLAITSTLFSCVNSDNYSAPDLSSECNDKVATKSIVDVAAIATAVPQQWNSTTDSIISAYVVSSDEGGNFYKSLSLVSLDGTKGFSVPIDDYNLYSKYEPGRQVFINLSKKYYANNTQTASLNVGNLYEGNSIGRLSNVEYQSVVARGCDKVSEESLINHVTISQAKSNAYINKLIEIDGVQFADEFLGKTYYDANNEIGGATNNIVKDINGSSMIVRVSSFATFATKMIPTGNGKIRGVMTKYNSDFQFMIRTENDVMLEGNRIVPLFEEPFTTNFPNWVKKSVIGAQVWGTTTFGNPAPCALMNGFSGTSQNNEDWLISPAIDLSTVSNGVLTFETSTRFNGPALTVWVSTNYDGTSAPNTATWTQLTANFPVWTSGSFTPWTASGGINISAYTGSPNFRVAFKYVSTTAGAASWEVDNVKVVGQ